MLGILIKEMLKNTFLHIPYISEATEKKLWKSNIFSWDDFLFHRNTKNIRNNELIKKYVLLSKDRLKNKDYEFFSSKLPQKHHWRAYDEFKDNCCFLDIETTGLNKYYDNITTIGIYNCHESKVFVNGIDLHKFPEEIKKYSMIITFNGSLFDIPFIMAKFPNLKLSQFHSDLRFVLKSLGYTGGLKKIEKDLGIARGSGLGGLCGRDAIRLWHMYKRNNDKKALHTLIRYNIEDIENLKILMDMSYEKLKNNSLSQIKDKC